ncbi:transglutaminase-like putative cysteine protease [Methanococcus maripaludis]|uniref:Transglutaminase-like putative cysteine protease n=1 Tax=Methanococcus maripaludis TaxID=39152 RepID=A0A7J9P2S1_METMI|nr:transglutaminase family protein [Methanococcus maripaludis]MBA2857513.1 transglutaminase-like putative cysteine protease [Methanococcus maripaludis]
MELIPESADLKEYLKPTNVIDYDNYAIKNVADRLAYGKLTDIEIAKEIYEFVRDNISNSGDINANEVTCTASEVLTKNHGICCAKSHLLAALLRYKGIPTGFCYQKLYSVDNKIPYIAIHGLNAIYLSSINKWIRLDARGNKEGINAEFSISNEKIAWPIKKELGEKDIPIIYVKPNAQIVSALTSCTDRDHLHLLWKAEIQHIFNKY